MKVKTALIFIIALTSFSGIIRHDVSKNEYLKLAKQPQFDCVGQVFDEEGSAGTCVLIDSQYVLTAAHVLFQSDYKPDTIEYNGQTVIVNTPINQRVGHASDYMFKFKNKMYQAKSITIHPTYTDTTPNGIDLALVTLENEVEDIKFAKLNLYANELNSKVVGVGFGASGRADKPETVDFHDKKIAGENRIDSIGPPFIDGNPTAMYCDFDHPTDTSCCNKMGSAEPMELEYISSGGDSGGGLFKTNKNEWVLVGILSGSMTDIDQLKRHGYYGQVMEWTRVSAIANWIESGME